MTWESVQESDSELTTRMKVLDGWLYRVVNKKTKAESLAFVKQPPVALVKQDERKQMVRNLKR